MILKWDLKWGFKVGFVEKYGLSFKNDIHMHDFDQVLEVLDSPWDRVFQLLGFLSFLGIDNPLNPFVLGFPGNTILEQYYRSHEVLVLYKNHTVYKKDRGFSILYISWILLTWLKPCTKYNYT